MIRATITDADALRSLAPGEIEKHLSGTGWQFVSRGQKASLWRLGVGDKRVEVIVPVHREFRDYARRVGEIVEALARVEERSQLDVFCALGGDIGTMPIPPFYTVPDDQRASAEIAKAVAEKCERTIGDMLGMKPRGWIKPVNVEVEIAITSPGKEGS